MYIKECKQTSTKIRTTSMDPELAMWDEPNAGLRCPNRRSSDTMKGVG